MENSIYFSIKRPDVVHETIEGETVIVNLENGNYYSLRKSGVDVWNLIESGVTFEEAVAFVRSHYKGDLEIIKKEIRALLIMFQEEDLVQISSEKPSLAKTPKPTNDPKEKKAEFVPPLFEKYSDMQQLLLLDPIHEVGEEGWPQELEENDNGQDK